jgi:sugar phosphate isomerase/epimerase
MFLSVLLPSFATDFRASLDHAAALGFSHVDVVGLASRPADDRDALADSGLTVGCASIGKGLPEGHTLDAVERSPRQTALEQMQRQLDDAAVLGATHGYIVPGTDASDAGRARFTDACRLLADHARQRMVRLCVEHVPGRALPSVRETLDWLDRVQHPNLSLLLDVGHCLISREDAAAMIRQAGERLGYIHFDDNDRTQDQHLPLLEGRLTEARLRAILDALRAIKYQGALCLELSPNNPAPVEAVRQSKELLQRLQGER